VKFVSDEFILTLYELYCLNMHKVLNTECTKLVL